MTYTKEERRVYEKNWNRKNPNKVKTKRLKYLNSGGRKKARLQKREYRKKIRIEVLSHYSNGKLQCMCKDCNIKELPFLTLDHINGGGTQDRKKVNRRGVEFYVYLKKVGYPKGFRVLCWNCNCSQAYFGKCPHNKLNTN